MQLVVERVRLFQSAIKTKRRLACKVRWLSVVLVSALLYKEVSSFGENVRLGLLVGKYLNNEEHRFGWMLPKQGSTWLERPRV